MAPASWHDCPEAVRNQIEGLVDVLAQRLGSGLTAVYLHGSLAMGCFNPSISDADLLAVVNEPMPLEVKRETAHLLLGASRRPVPVEISILCSAHLMPWRHPSPYEFHFSEDHRTRIQDELDSGGWRQWDTAPRTDPDLAAHVALTRRRGIALAGRRASHVLPDVPRADLTASILADLNWAIEPDRLRRNPLYAILNHCRAMVLFRDDLICSKDEGAVVALSSGLPREHRPTVETALALYRGLEPEVPLKGREVVEFLRYTRHRLAQLHTGHP